MSPGQFNKWLWLWQQGLAEEPEIRVIMLESLTDEAENSELMSNVDRLTEDLKAVGLVPGPDSYLYTRYWIGPEPVVHELSLRVRPLLRDNRCWTIDGATRAKKDWSEYWKNVEAL